jgi:hypothetical protein
MNDKRTSRARRTMRAGDRSTSRAIEAHIERYVGPIQAVLHEIVSKGVHIDIHIVAPTRRRDFYTWGTSGMSDRAMRPPPGFEALRWAELMICLPPTWPLAFRDPLHNWPARWLKSLARMPHEHKTWLGCGHTVPNGHPFAEAFAENTAMCCMFVDKPLLVDDDFFHLQISPLKVVHFYALTPIYRAEMELKLRDGADALAKRLEAHGVTELLDVARINTCAPSLVRKDTRQLH